MSAGTYNIDLNQNATFKSTLTITDGSGSYVDITGWTFKSSIRENFTFDDIVDFTITAISPISGTIEMLLPDVSSSVLSKTRYIYDLIAKNTTVSPTETYRIIQGKVTVSPAVTDLIS